MTAQRQGESGQLVEDSYLPIRDVSLCSIIQSHPKPPPIYQGIFQPLGTAIPANLERPVKL